MAEVRVSVVVATYNRPGLIRALLESLAAQTLDSQHFEVIVVDDGSEPPAQDALAGLTLPFAWRVIRQPNGRQGRARHRGIEEAQGEIIVILDDDMRPEPGLLAAHLAELERGADVVLGNIRPSAALTTMPLFERFHARVLTRQASEMASGARPVRGIYLCTGNVGFRRALYLASGGFDFDLLRSEDRELGIRFEKRRAKLAYAPDAVTVHDSDHASLAVWLGRAYLYGLWDAKIARRHSDVASANPWAFLFLVSRVSRPVLLSVVAMPRAAPSLARAIMGVSDLVDRRGFEALALAGTTLAYGVEYFHGVRDEAGGLGQALFDLARHAMGASEPMKEKSRRGAVRRFIGATLEDYASVSQYYAKYHDKKLNPWLMPVHLVQKIGLQMSVAVRLMHLLRDLRVPLGPQVASRLIRHVYGAEIHWDADISPGFNVIHGNGLVISHAAKTGRNVILFHNVTLGEGVDPVTREVGAPVLEDDVHVGPGATLIGPIRVGMQSKVMAGVVLAHDVAAHSLVKPAHATVETREQRTPAASSKTRSGKTRADKARKGKSSKRRAQ